MNNENKKGASVTNFSQIIGKMQGQLTVLRYELLFEDLTKEQIEEKLCKIIAVGDSWH